MTAKLHFFSKYSYIWKFEGEQEEKYNLFVQFSNLTSLRLVTFITLFGMSLFLLIDYFKVVDFSIVLVSRVAVLLGAMLIMWLSYKNLSNNGMVACVIAIVVLNFGASLITATFAGMPSFYLTNLLFLIFLLAVTASGLHLRHALLVNSVCLIAFLVYSNFVNRNPFYFSQYPHLFSIFIYIHIVGIVLENRRRRNFLLFNDLTEQKRLVEDLNQQKNKVISVLSHDVASPLNSLSALLYMQSSGEISETELKPYYKKLNEELVNVSFMLNSLVRWSRTQMEGFVLSKGEVNVLDLAENKKKFFRLQLEEKDLTLEIKADPLAFAKADENMTGIVIHNLISNAVKFARNGSQIQLVISKNGHDKVQVLVSNEGECIPPNLKERLFTYQTSPMSDTKGERGAGIGLVLAAYFVRLNGGEIYLMAPKDGANTFGIELPLASGPNQA